MALGARLIAVLALLVTALSAPGSSAAAAAPLPTELTLKASKGYAETSTELRLTLTSADGAPVAGSVVVQRKRAGDWTDVATVVADAAGKAETSAPLLKLAENNRFRARYAGDATYAPASSGAVQARLVKRHSKVTIGGPGTVVDGELTIVKVSWQTAGGLPVSGKVRLLRRNAGGSWKRAGSLRTGTGGRAERQTQPRVDTRWRAIASGSDWLVADRSRVHRVDNVPPGTPVTLPGGAPRPKIGLPRQQRAVGSGANAFITPIPDATWNQMVGRTWHAGCPVGRAGLRLVRINYWGYDGYRYRGELVAATGAAPRMAAALGQMHAQRFPLRSLYRVDRFGWSGRVHGGNDYASMDAGNTSAFNCRDVVNRPGVRSPHSYGRALDVNTWENPYRFATGLVPNSWWQSRSHPRVAWRSRSHGVVRIMNAQGLRWTYGLGDTQHFDVANANGRVPVYPGCEQIACD